MRRAAAAALIVASAATGPAVGAVIDVTMTGDSTADDGALSFREAVALAAGRPGPDVVRVPAGRYALDCAAGPITYDGRGALEILARGAELVEGCPGTGALRLTAGPEDVTLSGLTVTGAAGDGGGPLLQGAGRLRLVDVAVLSSGGPGVRCEPCGYLEVLRGRVRGSAGSGIQVTAAAGARVVIAESDIADNSVAGRGGGLRVTAAPDGRGGAAVVVGRSSVTGNRAVGSGAGGAGIAVAGADLRVEDSIVRLNRAGDGEWAGDGGGILLDDAAGNADLVVSGTTVAENTASAAGGGLAIVGGGDAQVDTSWIDGNVAGRDGGGLSAVAGADSTLTVISSTFSRNVAGEDAGGGGLSLRGPGLVGISATTVDGNAAGRGGGIMATDEAGVALQRSTVSDNRATAGADVMATAAAVRIVQSMVVLPRGGTACAATGTGVVAGAGYSFLADASCGAGSADVVSSADPRLGPLAPGADGETPVRTPAADSPAAGLMPGDLCADDEDQRGVPRPQGDRCDAGAVEVVEAPRPGTPSAFAVPPVIGRGRGGA